MEKYVAISADPNELYSFFLPLVARAWDEYIGYRPIALLYGDPERWNADPKSAFVLKSLEGHAEIAFVKGVPGFRVSTVMQTVRLYPSAFEWVGSQDYILTTDVDMVPLEKAYFSSQDPAKRFHLFGADAYADLMGGEEPSRFPLCYLGASAGDWRSVMGIQTADIDHELAYGLEGRPDRWTNDEEFFAERIIPHPLYQGPLEAEGTHFRRGDVQLLRREWTCGRALRRVDRVAWGFHGEKDLIDCHAVRPGYDGLPVLSELIDAYLPSLSDTFRRYATSFMELKEKHG